MDCYLGIDIGTTNTKVLALGEDGSTRVELSSRTPTYHRDGVAYFDLSALDRTLRAAVSDAGQRYTIRGIGFSSIGESVVPLDAAGDALEDALVWYDQATREIEAELSVRRSELFPYARRGLRSEHTLSVYKMLWMRRHLPATSGVASWLPVSSYVPYLWSGSQKWDYSQACRSYLLDIHDRSWDESVLQTLQLDGQLPPIEYMGTMIGHTASGIPLYLGGHDHIVGMNGVRALYGSDTIFDSIGSASVLGGTVEMPEADMERTLETSDDLIAGVAHAPGWYYVENSTRYFGKLLETTAGLLSNDAPEVFYRRFNRGMNPQSIPEELPLFLVEGDRIVRQEKAGFDIRELSTSTDTAAVVWGLYLYLALMTRMIRDEIRGMFRDPVFLAGGGASRNTFLMQLTSDVLGTPVTLVDVSELSALGAAVTAAEGAGDDSVVLNTRRAMEERRLEPSDEADLVRSKTARLEDRMKAVWARQ